VLYECLTGERAFGGESLTDVLSAIVSDEPGWAALPAGMPAGVRRLLRRCLEKDPRRRLRDVGEARIELEGAREEPESAVAAEPLAQLRRLRLVTGLALALAAALGAVALWALRSSEPAEPAAVRRLSIASDWLSMADNAYQSRQGLDISRDGKLVAFVGKGGIFLRRMDQAGAAPVPGTTGAGVVGMSPDGEWLGFGRGRRLLKAPLGGGMPIEVAEVPGSADQFVSSIAWSRDGNIYFSGNLDGYHALFRVPERGGTPELLLDVSDGQGTRRDMGSLQLIDDARKLLFTVAPGNRLWRPDNAKVVVLDLDSGEETIIADSGGFARYVPSGHLLVAQGDDDFTLEPFDIDRLEATGPRVPYRAGLVGKENGMVAHLAFALDGTLVHEAGGAASAARELTWFGLDGEQSVLSAGSRRFTVARLSDDSDRVAVTVQNDQGRSELWIHDVSRGGLTKLTMDDHDYQYPTWTPDGQSLIYVRSLRGQNARVFRWNVLGGEDPQELMDPGTIWFVPEDVSPDGQHLVGFTWDTETDKHWDLVVVSLEGDPTPQRFAASTGNELEPRFSPDGRWIAYDSDRSGSFEVYLKRFPEQGAAIQVSRGGGRRALWDPRGEKLYFYDGDERALMAVDVVLGPTPGAGMPERVAEIPPELAPGEWDPWGSIAADGRLLVVSKPGGPDSHIDVVLNWFDELRRLAPR
jgi:serine/threonine-protein kinase